MAIPSERTIAILGASNNSDRYANMAQALLMKKGFDVLPVSKKDSVIMGVATVAEVASIQQPIDTVTLYVGPQGQKNLINAIVALQPGRVIFNPGTENPEFYKALDTAGIDYEEACTLVLLRTGQF